MQTLRRAWQSNRALTAAFVIVCLITLLLAFRLVGSAIYWSNHTNEPLKDWMRLGYIAKSHGVDVEDLRRTLGLPPDERERRTISELSRDLKIPPEELQSQLEKALAQIKNDSVSN